MRMISTPDLASMRALGDRTRSAASAILTVIDASDLSEGLSYLFKLPAELSRYHPVSDVAWRGCDELSNPVSFIDRVVVPVARHLGQLWEEDLLSFTDVTLTSAQLLMMLMAHEEEHGRATALPAHGRSIVLATAADDQHALGLACIAYLLRQAGWEVERRQLNPDAAGQRIDADVIALSVGHERALARCSGLIARLRRSSANPDVRIVVGGPMIVGRADVARATGADLWAEDGPQLVRELATRFDLARVAV